MVSAPLGIGERIDMVSFLRRIPPYLTIILRVPMHGRE